MSEFGSVITKGQTQSSDDNKSAEVPWDYKFGVAPVSCDEWNCTVSRIYPLYKSDLILPIEQKVSYLKLYDDKYKGARAHFVSWLDAIVYCNIRSRIEGLEPAYTFSDLSELKATRFLFFIPTGEQQIYRQVVWKGPQCPGYRLPIEAEWRMVSRMPESWGISDMFGNVQEWCWDSAGVSTRKPNTYLSGDKASFVHVLGRGDINFRPDLPKFSDTNHIIANEMPLERVITGGRHERRGRMAERKPTSGFRLCQTIGDL